MQTKQFKEPKKQKAYVRFTELEYCPTVRDTYFQKLEADFLKARKDFNFGKLPKTSFLVGVLAHKVEPSPNKDDSITLNVKDALDRPRGPVTLNYWRLVN